MNNILVVEDHQTTRKGLVSLLKNSGYQVDDADDGLEAESMITGTRYDLILVDLVLPQENGLKLLKKAKEIFPSTEVIIFTGNQTIETAIYAMKLGAYDYLLKPLDPQEVINTVNQAIERKNFVKNSSNFAEPWPSIPCLLGRSRQMIEIFKLMSKMLNTENPVMIIGEPGTGKKSLAQAVHKNSPGKTSPFIMLNCSVIPDNLSEEQAFNYLKTKILENIRADHNRDMRCTLFLNNIDMASPSIQTSLLFFLDNHSSSSDLKKTCMGNIRLISSSRKNLKKLMDKKLLRQDLFFRINTLPIYIPPLRERKVDIPLLANHFSNKYAISPKSLSSEVLALFMKYQWPGNVQELKNVIEYAVLMANRGQITLDDLPGYLKDAEPSFCRGLREKDLTLGELEKMYILEQLDANGWDQKKTAGHLGIGRTTLWRRLKQYGVAAPHSKKLEG